ncbi:hypothetical protein CAP35_03625 [Chitinophagaceae bacterium IBVUCB1]|nr:hypothetical protein CAP35_03625 [Chitinophagaceae bacterium IBVUCB1]
MRYGSVGSDIWLFLLLSTKALSLLMRTIALLLIIILPIYAGAQQPSRDDLVKRRQSILESIKQTEAQLEATKNDKNATMGQLRALQNRLAERQRLIRNINEEIGQLNNSIQTSTNEVAQLKQNLEVLKMRYAQSVRYAYRSRSSYDMLAFLFSSQDFNEALRRVKYLKKYREYRKQQADKIRVTQGIIVKKIDVLNAEKSEKDMLLSTEEKQKQEIQKETNETNAVVKELKGREKQLMAQIDKDKRATKQLNKAIEDMIRREMEIARKKAEEEARKRAEEERRRQEEAKKANMLAAAGGNPANKPTTQSNVPASQTNKPAINNNTNQTRTSTTPQPAVAKVVVPKNYDYSLTPEANALSNSFETNRGRLPWPVEKGFISQGFGKYKHAIAQKVEMENLGIDISTAHGATARAVFEGTVRVFSIDGKEWNVMVNHGAYYTLYMHLSKTFVQNGQKVQTKQSIGTVKMNDEGESILNFQVWKNTTKLNPEVWIAR